MVKLIPSCNVRHRGAVPEYDALKVQSKSQPYITLTRDNIPPYGVGRMRLNKAKSTFETRE